MWLTRQFAFCQRGRWQSERPANMVDDGQRGRRQSEILMTVRKTDDSQRGRWQRGRRQSEMSMTVRETDDSQRGPPTWSMTVRKARQHGWWQSDRPATMVDDSQRDRWQSEKPANVVDDSQRDRWQSEKPADMVDDSQRDRWQSEKPANMVDDSEKLWLGPTVDSKALQRRRSESSPQNPWQSMSTLWGKSWFSPPSPLPPMPPPSPTSSGRGGGGSGRQPQDEQSTNIIRCSVQQASTWQAHAGEAGRVGSRSRGFDSLNIIASHSSGKNSSRPHLIERVIHNYWCFSNIANIFDPFTISVPYASGLSQECFQDFEKDNQITVLVIFLRHWLREMKSFLILLPTRTYWFDFYFESTFETFYLQIEVVFIWALIIAIWLRLQIMFNSTATC